MPLYTVMTKSNLSKEIKTKAAKAITDIHCDTTGAPTEFVNVVFMTGHRLKDGKKAVIMGNVRNGGNRTDESINALKNKIHQGVTAALTYPIEKVNIEFLPFEPTWAWEGGEVLPYPGAETSWFARKNNKKKEIEHA